MVPQRDGDGRWLNKAVIVSTILALWGIRLNFIKSYKIQYMHAALLTTVPRLPAQGRLIATTTSGMGTIPINVGRMYMSIIS